MKTFEDLRRRFPFLLPSCDLTQSKRCQPGEFVLLRHCGECWTAKNEVLTLAERVAAGRNAALGIGVREWTAIKKDTGLLTATSVLEHGSNPGPKIAEVTGGKLTQRILA